MDILIPSFKTPELTSAVIKSYIKNDKIGFINKIIIVENSEKTSYFKEIKSISPKIICIKNKTSLKGSEANASAIKIGKSYSKEEYLFLSHSDSAVINPIFFENLKTFIKKDYFLVGTLRDKLRIGALHSSGLLVKKFLLDKVNISPVSKRIFPKIWKRVYLQDVCDPLTAYARRNSIKYHCFKNTYNGYSIKNCSNSSILSRLDTTINEKDEPIFVHLGRGTPKSHGNYKIKNKITPEQFIDFLDVN